MSDESSKARRDTCLICGFDLTEVTCQQCGADAKRVQQLIAGTIKSADGRIFERFAALSEQLWNLLSEDFRRSIVDRYRTLNRSVMKLTCLIFIPALVLLHAGGFLLGMIVSANYLHWPPENWSRILFSLCISAALVLGLGFTAGSYIEARLHESKKGLLANKLLQSLNYVGTQMVKRAAPSPLLSSDFWYPAATGVGLGIGLIVWTTMM